MPSGASPPLKIWAVSDGRVGIEAQALGLAEAVARTAAITARELKDLLWECAQAISDTDLPC